MKNIEKTIFNDNEKREKHKKGYVFDGTCPACPGANESF